MLGNYIKKLYKNPNDFSTIIDCKNNKKILNYIKINRNLIHNIDYNQSLFDNIIINSNFYRKIIKYLLSSYKKNLFMLEKINIYENEYKFENEFEDLYHYYNLIYFFDLFITLMKIYNTDFNNLIYLHKFINKIFYKLFNELNIIKKIEEDKNKAKNKELIRDLEELKKDFEYIYVIIKKYLFENCFNYRKFNFKISYFCFKNKIFHIDFLINHKFCCNFYIFKLDRNKNLLNKEYKNMFYKSFLKYSN